MEELDENVLQRTAIFLATFNKHGHQSPGRIKRQRRNIQKLTCLNLKLDFVKVSAKNSVKIY